MKEQHRGRNVININQLRETILRYAKETKRSKEVSLWLEKNFLRWVINHFSYVQVVQSEERYKSLLRGAIPSWFQPENSDVEFIYIDVNHLKFQELLENCSEFLSSRHERVIHKFPRMTVPQVLAKWKEEHERFTRRQKVYKETSSEGLLEVFRYEAFRFVKFDATHQELSLEMARESALMQHCLGEFDNDVLGEGGYGAYYLKRMQNTEIELYSLRDEQNMPHVTIALDKQEGKLILSQIKGKQNISPVSRYIPACVAFLNFLKVVYAYHADTLSMGVVYLEGRSQRIEEIEDERTQQFLVAYDTQLIERLKKPSKATQWLATLRKPNTVTKIKEANDAMKISALLQ